MITCSDLLLNGMPLGSYTIDEIQKICKKNKKKDISLYCTYDLKKLEPSEVERLYLKICSYFILEFKYKGKIFLLNKENFE